MILILEICKKFFAEPNRNPNLRLVASIPAFGGDALAAAIASTSSWFNTVLSGGFTTNDLSYFVTLLLEYNSVFFSS